MVASFLILNKYFCIIFLKEGPSHPKPGSDSAQSHTRSSGYILPSALEGPLSPVWTETWRARVPCTSGSAAGGLCGEAAQSSRGGRRLKRVRQRSEGWACGWICAVFSKPKREVGATQKSFILLQCAVAFLTGPSKMEFAEMPLDISVQRAFGTFRVCSVSCGLWGTGPRNRTRGRWPLVHSSQGWR